MWNHRRCNPRQLFVFAALLTAPAARAGEEPYFITYSHHMEEPGSLELAATQVLGTPSGGSRFLGHLLELEYGVKAWWTAELYLSGQTTWNQSTLFTGYRAENRIRPLMREHWINPVLYFEWSDTNGADKSLREIVGHDGFEDQLEPNGTARAEREREVELKLILSSDFRGWNLSENLIAEKVINHPESWEFGYAYGISRPLAGRASPGHCTLCPENFRVGVEMYGGLGTRHSFGLQDTSHYVAPVVAWQLPNNTTLRFSPGFGLTGNSYGVLWRFTVAHEIDQFGRLFGRGER